ncbi:hypothetical protein [Bosea sp. LjRoot237]|uniref:hypothetical protein n=1 Tax=Bosea sp. LjRoot237 TaxID=3342292 RepID=UPI003ECECA33
MTDKLDAVDETFRAYQRPPNNLRPEVAATVIGINFGRALLVDAATVARGPAILIRAARAMAQAVPSIVSAGLVEETVAAAERVISEALAAIPAGGRS